MTEQQIEETRALLEVAQYIAACARMLIENPFVIGIIEAAELAMKSGSDMATSENMPGLVEGARFFVQELDTYTAKVGVDSLERAAVIGQGFKEEVLS